MKMKELKREERGFSLIELLIVIALTGIITAAITMTVFQVFNMNTRTSNRMTAVSQVQNAGKIVSEDILEAQNITAAVGTGFPLSLNWTDPASGNHTAVTYTLVSMPSMPPAGPQRLQRSVTVRPPGGPPATTVSIVAEYISVASIAPTQPCFFPNCSVRACNFTVTATVGKESETRVYQVKPRPGS